MRQTAGGVTLNCRIDGRSDGEWLVACHALATGLDLWEPQLEMLGRRFRVLRYDMRGHGESAAPAPPYAVDDLAADAIGLMDSLGIFEAHFLGLSIGGTTGLALAARHPGRLLSLAACCCRADTPPGGADLWDARIAMVRRDGMQPLADQTLQRWFTPEFLAQSPPWVARIRSMIVRTAPDGYVGCAEALKGLRLGDRLGTIRAPVLFVAAAGDSGAPPELSRDMQSQVPGSGFALIERASHLANIEQPAAFNTILGDFYDRLAVQAREQAG